MDILDEIRRSVMVSASKSVYVYDSVWDSVSIYVWDSVDYSVCDSVFNSVYVSTHDSVRDLLETYDFKN